MSLNEFKMPSLKDKQDQQAEEKDFTPVIKKESAGGRAEKKPDKINKSKK